MHIYKFTHIQSGKSYIGQTIQDPNQRKLEHICDSRYSPKTYHFHNAIRKYGIDAFTFEIIDQATSLDKLNKLEELYVEKYNSIDNGFNIRQPGGNKKHSPESIERMREAQRAAHARRKAEGRDGGWKRRDGGPMKGKTQSLEARQKQSISKIGANNPCFGKSWKIINGKRIYFNKEASV